MVVGRGYFRTGDYLHGLEDDSDTTVADVESVVKATRKHFGLLDTNEIIVVIDSVRGLAADGLVATNDADTPSHLARRMMELKNLARRQNAAAAAYGAAGR